MRQLHRVVCVGIVLNLLLIPRLETLQKTPHNMFLNKVILYTGSFLAPGAITEDLRQKYEAFVNAEAEIWAKKDYPSLREFLDRDLDAVMSEPNRLKPYFSENTILDFMYGQPAGALQMAFWWEKKISRQEVIDLIIKAKRIEEIFKEKEKEVYEKLRLLGIPYRFNDLFLYYNPDDFEAFREGSKFNEYSGQMDYALMVNMARLEGNNKKIFPQYIKMVMLHEIGHIVFKGMHPEFLTQADKVIPVMSSDMGIHSHEFIDGLRFDFFRYEPVCYSHFYAVLELIANWVEYKLCSKEEFEFSMRECIRGLFDNFEYGRQSNPDAELNNFNLAQFIALIEYAGIEKDQSLKDAEALLGEDGQVFKRGLCCLLERLWLIGSDEVGSILRKLDFDKLAGNLTNIAV